VPPPDVPAGSIYFLTICSSPRRKNQLAHPASWSAIKSAASFYHEAHRWHVRLLLAMPDHLHLLASFPSVENMSNVVRAWKHFTAHSIGIIWHRDFFDHRLRSSSELDEKSQYIRLNPIRAGLVNTSAEWPYVWGPEDGVALPW
jgi:putative transposase